jgi:predicted ATP-grasp superfamily ATP-dependent carboligase
MENLDLTVLEQKALTRLINGLYAEAGFSDMDANDLVTEEMDIKQVRGMLGSLQKKGIVSIQEPNDGGYKIIDLNEGYWYLHPYWKDEVQ